MRNKKIKTIDLIAKTWLQRGTANRYFSAQLTINYQMNGEKTFYLPFQLGPNESYQYEAVKVLIREGLISKEYEGRALWSVTKLEGIISRCSATETKKEREIKEWGIAPKE